MDYKKLLQTSEYDFLRTNPYLGNHILLLTLGGSRAYGTNLPTSDVDIRGIAATPMSALFGLEKDFEQVVETNTDTVIYSMQKINMENLQEMMFGIYEKQFDKYKKKDFYNYLDQL